MQALNHRADGKGLFDNGAQIHATAFTAIGQSQGGTFKTNVNQVGFKRAIIFQILFRLTALDFVKWWLGDIEMAALNQLAHLAVEEGQQQRSDMCSDYVGN